MQYAILAVLNNWDTNDLSTMFKVVELEASPQNSKEQIIEAIIDEVCKDEGNTPIVKKEESEQREYVRDELYEIYVFKSSPDSNKAPELVIRWEQTDLYP